MHTLYGAVTGIKHDARREVAAWASVRPGSRVGAFRNVTPLTQKLHKLVQ